jgi:hypothetical protein
MMTNKQSPIGNGGAFFFIDKIVVDDKIVVGSHT